MHLGSSCLPSNRSSYLGRGEKTGGWHSACILITSIEALSIASTMKLFLNVSNTPHGALAGGGRGRFFEGGGQANAENRQRLKCQNNTVGILKGREQSRRNITSNTLISGALISLEKHPGCTKRVSLLSHRQLHVHSQSSQHIRPKQAHTQRRHNDLLSAAHTNQLRISS